MQYFIKPLLVLPIKRSSILHYVLGKWAVSFFNFLPLFAVIPFGIMLILEEYGTTTAVVWMVTMVIFTLIINFLNIIIESRSAETEFSFLPIVLIASGLFALNYFEVVSFSTLLANGINAVDASGANCHMSSVGICALLTRMGYAPIMQIACRDKNRIAIQGDVLGAAAMGVANIMCLTGDGVQAGDQPGAKPVFDLDCMSLLETVRTMRDESKFLSGRKLTSPPKVFLGAAINPFAPPYDFRPYRLGKKIEAGAQFVQSQYCFDVPMFRDYMKKVRDLGFHEKCYILVGVGPLASAKTAKWIRSNVPGIHIPDHVIARLEGAQDRFVLVPHADPQVVLAQHRRHDAAHVLPVRLRCLGDQRIARGLVDEQVEVDIGFDHERDIAARHGAAADIDQQAAAMREFRYNMAYINHAVCSKDNGRVLGYDNAHGYHHRHFFGVIEPIEFFSFEDIEERFELDWTALKGHK